MRSRALAVLPFLLLCFSELVAADRTVWIYEGGYYENTDGRNWTEVTPNGRSSFVEVTRNSDFIEIYDEGRKMNVRLYDTEEHWSTPENPRWSLSQRGRWNSSRTASQQQGDSRPPVPEAVSSSASAEEWLGFHSYRNGRKRYEMHLLKADGANFQGWAVMTDCGDCTVDNAEAFYGKVRGKVLSDQGGEIAVTWIAGRTDAWKFSPLKDGQLRENTENGVVTWKRRASIGADPPDGVGLTDGFRPGTSSHQGHGVAGSNNRFISASEASGITLDSFGCQLGKALLENEQNGSIQINNQGIEFKEPACDRVKVSWTGVQAHCLSGSYWTITKTDGKKLRFQARDNVGKAGLKDLAAVVRASRPSIRHCP